jgi:hypothetical protein
MNSAYTANQRAYLDRKIDETEALLLNLKRQRNELSLAAGQTPPEILSQVFLYCRDEGLKAHWDIGNRRDHLHDISWIAIIAVCSR